MYEIATIGAVTGASERAPRPVVLGGIPASLQYVTTPTIVAAGAGLVVGLVLGALVFGGRRG